MANPEHVKIVRAGKKAIGKWWGENQDRLDKIPPNSRVSFDLKNADLRGIGLDLCDLSFANLEGADMSDFSNYHLHGVNFIGATLFNIKITHAVITNCDFTHAKIDLCKFNHLLFDNCNFHATTLYKVNFCDSSLTECLFTNAILSNCDLNGITIGNCGIDSWELINNNCEYFFSENQFGRYRIPENGFLAPGEFEDRFKTRPTIEFMFKHGMPALGPAVLDLAISQANMEKPKAGFRLLDITARGGIPRAIIEITQKISKEDALGLVSACYHQKLGQMQKEIEGLRNDKNSLLTVMSQKILLPAMDGLDSFMSVTDLAKYYNVDAEALRKRLDRQRKKHVLDTDFYTETQNRGTRKPTYLYNIKMVAPIVEELNKKQTSNKRPTKEN